MYQTLYIYIYSLLHSLYTYPQICLDKTKCRCVMSVENNTPFFLFFLTSYILDIKKFTKLAHPFQMNIWLLNYRLAFCVCTSRWWWWGSNSPKREVNIYIRYVNPDNKYKQMERLVWNGGGVKDVYFPRGDWGKKKKKTNKNYGYLKICVKIYFSH